MGIGENVGENVGENTGQSGQLIQEGASWYSGTWAHGNVITLNGSGFGTKDDNGGSTDYLCSVWDDCSGSAPSTIWDGENWPSSSGADWNVDYRTPATVDLVRNSGTSPNPAHSRATQYLCGCHYPGSNVLAGDNVMVGKQLPNYPGDGWRIYASWYERVDSSWGGLASDYNYKRFHVNDTANYIGPLTYFDSPLNSLSNSTIGSWEMNRNSGACSNWLVSWEPDAVNVNNESDGRITKSAADNPAADWVKVETIIWMTATYDDKNQYATERFIIRDNNTDKTKFYGAMEWYAECSTPVTRYAHIGGYARNNGGTDTYKNNWRYFNDLYLDVTGTGTSAVPRVVLTDNATYASSTVIVPQPPLTASAGNGFGWTDTRVDIEVNLAEFSASDAIYCHIFSSDGSTQYLGQAVAV